ncbi:hypothetical protein BKA62DRAFT_836174 [Auriculariales sp. MPI-PUGE-AT-0066]|nr:hypothetical protein BKA62DRAFT_836174 [Auriculariales sp. MPI-PUGE-AT-0066]
MLLGAASASGSSNPRHSSSEPPAAAAPNDQLHPWPTRRIGPLEITGYVDSTAGVDQLELRFEVYFHPSGWTTNSTYYQQFFAPIFACTVDLRHPDYGMSVSARFRPPHSTCITGEVSCGVVVALDTTGYERRWLAQPVQQPRLNIDLQRIGPLEITGFVDFATHELQLDVYYRPPGWNMNYHTLALCTPAVYSDRVPLKHPDHGISVIVQFQPPRTLHLTGRIECGVVVTHGTQTWHGAPLVGHQSKFPIGATGGWTIRSAPY